MSIILVLGENNNTMISYAKRLLEQNPKHFVWYYPEIDNKGKFPKTRPESTIRKFIFDWIKRASVLHAALGETIIVVSNSRAILDAFRLAVKKKYLTDYVSITYFDNKNKAIYTRILDDGQVENFPKSLFATDLKMAFKIAISK